MSTPITAREFFAGIPANTPPYIPELHQDDCEDTTCTRCVDTTTQLHEIDVPFIPTNDDMDATYNGVGVTGFDDGTAIALTSDRQDARAAFVAYLNSQSIAVTSDEDLNIDMRVATFIRPDERDDNAWLANFGGEEGPFTAVAWLET